MILQVRNMSPVSFQTLHRLECRGDIAGSTEIVAVQMQRMRQPQIVDDLGQPGHDRAGRDFLITGDRI